MVPGILMSLNTMSICVRLANTATASSALAASITLYPASRRNSATALRIRISSSTTRTAGSRVAPSCDAIALDIAPQTPMIPEQARGTVVPHPGAIPLRLRCRSPSFKKNVDSAHDLLRMVRLLQETFVAEIRGLLSRPGYSRGQDQVDAGMLLAKPLGKTEPIHAAAELDLGEDDVDLLSGPKHGHRVVGRDPFENPVPALAQIIGNGHAHQDIRLYNENCARRSRAGARVIYRHVR